jgi:sphinganine C4-monooxygenase
MYWVYSFFFQILDSIDSPLLDRYRIHESAEVKSRNLVSRTSCLLWVAFQQVVQTVMAWYWMDEGKELPEFLTNIPAIKDSVVSVARLLLGEATAAHFLRAYGARTVWFVYWWAIPLTQLTIAM